MLCSRNEIASCEETAYDSLPVAEAAQLLFFKSSHDLILFAQSVSTYAILLPSSAFCSPVLYLQRGWQLDLVNQMIHFQRKGEEKVAIPKQKMIVAALEYAKELEQIV